MIFLDSTVLIDYFNGTTNWQVEKLDSLLGKEIVVLGDYVLTEVLQGFRSNSDFERASTILKAFPCFNICGKEIAIQSAKNYRYLRKMGITVRKTIDAIIATFCIENSLILLHNDKDFDPFVKYLNLTAVEK
ncbi:MAG: PIN domain nuclease [Bacteroidetes bacterium]|nr:PIN domain nuclease [Bacteroidota bacterium]MBU1679275.1 PIN domain nuclease [Bacteroidota bacterium]MBU2506504.1 PIN domain nuclease [Bacteroidota bacterium]